MFANVALGAVIVAILVFELVYLPLKNEMVGTAPKTESAARQDDPVQDRHPFNGIVDVLSQPTSPKEAERRVTRDEPSVGGVGRPVDQTQGGGASQKSSVEGVAAPNPVGGDKDVIAHLNRDIVDLREQLNSMSRDKAVGEAERKAVDTARASDRLEVESERKRASELTARSAAADREAASQSAALQRQLDGAEARSRGLDQDLKDARVQLIQMTRGREDAERTLRTAEATHATDEAKLMAEQKAVADQADRSKSAGPDASSRADALQLQLGVVQAHSVSLERDGARADERLKQAARSLDQKSAELTLMRQQVDGEHLRSTKLEQALASAKQATMQARLDIAARDREQTEARAASALKSDVQQKPAEAQEGQAAAEQVSAQVQALQKQLADERARSQALRTDMARARSAASSSPKDTSGRGRRLEAIDEVADGGVPQVGRKGMSDPAARPPTTGAGLKSEGAEPSHQNMPIVDLPRQYASRGEETQAASAGEGRGISSHAALPRGVQPNIVLHYSRDSQVARDRASLLKASLQSSGLSVEDAGASVRYGGSDRVTFYYDEDEREADRVADMSAKVKPVKSRLPRNRAVIPGTIDVVIVG